MLAVTGSRYARPPNIALQCDDAFAFDLRHDRSLRTGEHTSVAVVVKARHAQVVSINERMFTGSTTFKTVRNSPNMVGEQAKVEIGKCAKNVQCRQR